MDRLPKETFLLITDYLDFETRFQFSYVCKRWHSIISNHNLYETVYIDRDHEGPIDYFDHNKSYGLTVKSLQVNGIGLTFSHIRKWPDYFPNIINFSLAIAEADMFSSDYEEEYDEDEDCYEEEGQCFNTLSESFKAWKRLASISEFTKFMYTGSILISGHYPNLTSMDLNFNLIPYHASDAVMNNLLLGIKNAQNLKYLKLIVAQLTLSKLDILHQNAPSIEGLILEDISLGEDTVFAAETFYENFIPKSASKLTRLEMQGSRHSFYENDQLSILDWLQYIAQKYPNIEVIKMNQFTPASSEHESSIVNVINHCKKLKTFNVDFCTLSASVLSAFDGTAIKLEKYSTLSQDLTELRNLSISKQRHSIYRLDLVVPINNTDLIHILSQFTGLTTINTYPSSDIDYTVGKPLQVPLNTFLKHHKLLEFLSLSSCEIFLDDDFKEEKLNLVLDTLELEKVTIKPSSSNVFDFISKSCPQLKVMILTARFSEYPKQNPTILNFSNHTIVYLKVYIEGHEYIRVDQCIGDEVTTWYKIEKEGRKIKYTLQETPSDNYNNKTGLLRVNAQRIERFVVNLPRDPFQRV